MLDRKGKRYAIRDLKQLIKRIEAGNIETLKVEYFRDVPPGYPNPLGGSTYIMGLPYTVKCTIEINVIPKTKKRKGEK